MICPECQSGTRVHKVEGPIRIRACLGCSKRFRTEEVLVYEIGGEMTEERLLQIVQERVRPQTLATLAKHFCVSESSISRVLNKLESEGHVRYEIRDGKKYWSATTPKVKQRSDPKPKADPVAFSDSGRVITNRIARPGEEAPTPKRRAETPQIRQQSWFSAIEQ